MSRSSEGFSDFMSSRSTSRGEDLASRWQVMCNAFRRLPHRLARVLPAVRGVKSSGKFLDGQENTLLKIGETLRDSGAIFRYGSDILYINGTESETIVDAAGVTRSAQAVIANVALFQEETKANGTVDFLAPPAVLSAVFHNRTVLRLLPEIVYLAKAPVFGPDFILLQGPKFHECGIMVLAQPIDPAVYSVIQVDNAIDRLPPLLRAMLGGFCFRSNADVANTLAVLITAVLMNHCLDFDRALIIVDGNRPNVGKTWLVRTLGMIIDGEPLSAIAYDPNDEELRKRITARIQRSRCRLLCIDNAKTVSGAAVSSPLLESHVSDSIISDRILGTSNEVAVKNDFLFALTMNSTNVSPDLLSRALPIRLFYEEGDPRHRTFKQKNPVQFARQYRDGILAELLGMVDYWVGKGRPVLPFSHRCHEWAALIGSILHCCGFPEFLENFDAAAEEFNSQTEEVRELFDAVYTSVMPGTTPSQTVLGGVIRVPTKPLPSAGWGDYLRQIRGHVDTLGRAKGNTGVGMQARRILGVYLNCEFEFSGNYGTGKATLRSEKMSGRQTGYFFEAMFDAPEPYDSTSPDVNDTENIPL